MAVAEALLNGTRSRRVSGPGPICVRQKRANCCLLTGSPPRGPIPARLLRLILMADAGGSAATFRGWCDRLPTAEVGIVQLPGSGERLHEPFVLTVAEAAQAIADEVAAGAGNSTVLFGHGLGALIAFETARRLAARRWPVLSLFVSGQSAPSLGLMAPRVSDLPADEFVEPAPAAPRMCCRPTAVGDPDVLRMLLPIVRADVAMAESYRYEPAVAARLPD